MKSLQSLATVPTRQEMVVNINKYKWKTLTRSRSFRKISIHGTAGIRQQIKGNGSSITIAGWEFQVITEHIEVTTDK